VLEFPAQKNAPPSEQKMADLPEFRLDIHQPLFFSHWYRLFWPFHGAPRSEHCETVRVHFTCMLSRAVYLEVLLSVSADFFISGLHRFVRRKGEVGHLYSDNATNFIDADQILTESVERWNQKQISDFLPQKEIDWHFNTHILAASGND